MKFGVVYPGTDPRQAVRCAVEAEAAGWDAFFAWEAVWSADPWVILGAAAARTERIRLGTMLTPIPIRRPWKLAGESATLDALSGGRLILSAGLGAADTGYAEFGLPTARRTRAELLDENLDILMGLWSGKPFAYSGQHYRIREAKFMPAPTPIQQRGGEPHIPIWMVGAWKRERSLRRVLRCDGLLPNVLDGAGAHRPASPEDVAAMRAWLDEHAPAGRAIDLVLEGSTPGNDPAAQRGQLGPIAAAGATWWVEAHWQAESPDAVLARVRQGPPTEA